MRNYLFSLIACCALITPAFAQPPHYVEGKLVNYANPVYPRRAMENGEEGTSVVRAAVAPDGRAYGAHTEKSSGHPRLDRFAVKGMDAARFQPACYRGKPVWQAVSSKIEFKLD